MFWILGLICIILGFIVGAFDVKILFAPLEWFVAAIAFNTLGGPSWPSFTRRGEG
jgi:hypothetical protein